MSHHTAHHRLNSPWLICVPSCYSPPLRSLVTDNNGLTCIAMAGVWLGSGTGWYSATTYVHTSAFILTFSTVQRLLSTPQFSFKALSVHKEEFTIIEFRLLTGCDQVNVIWAACCHWLRCRGIVYSIRAVCTPQTGCTVHFSHICAGRRGWWYSSINCKLIRDLLWKAPCNTFDSIHHSIIIADQLSLGSCRGNEAVINVWLVKIITIQ